MRTLLASCALLASACLGTETGNPPAAPVIDVSKIELRSVGGGIEVTGRAGAIEPAGASARLVNLDGVMPLVVAAVGDDGSFSALVPAIADDVIRLQARLGDLRSGPVDFVLASSPTPASGCLVVELDVDLGTLAAGELTAIPIEIVNECEGDANLFSNAFRTSDPAFEYRAPVTPHAMSEGARATLDLAVTPSAPGELEEILLLGVTTPDGIDRIAITLYGEAL
jgi:hypothetical protein